jgi:DNA-nicking Smr family endonuclease
LLSQSAWRTEFWTAPVARKITRPPKPTDRPETSSDADTLFEKEMASVKPLQHKQATLKRAQATPTQSHHPDHDAETIEGDDVLRFLRPGQQQSVLKNLRRMRISGEATLDLHGYTSVEAAAHLQRFVQNARAQGLRAIRIIHGKGRGSANAPVLKTMADRWLRESPDVLAFCSAQPQNGGTGAVDILLRK